MGNIPMPLAYLIDWGWLRIGPYIHINIDPVIVHLGPLALRWYGLMYAVAIAMGLWLIRNYTRRKGIISDKVYRVLWWCIIGGLIGGRLYFVVQQPNLVTGYLEQPWNILATWEGGMAFFGAIFVVVPLLFWRSLRERINPLVMLDAAALFAACAQPFGRIGNLINGDITGAVTTLPWGTVYDNMNSWACLNPNTCQVPLQPAAGYELLLNLVLIAVLFFLASRFRRPGALMATYLFGYCVTQFIVFFARASEPFVKLGGVLDLGLKQAQWTAIIFALILIPITVLVMRSRFAQPVPAGEIPATYGMPQEPAEDDKDDAAEPKDAQVEDNEPAEVVEQDEKVEEPPEEVAGKGEEASEQAAAVDMPEVPQEAES